VKISNDRSILDTNNKDTDSIDFGIGDVSTIIDILRNRLYSNPIRTLTQEYLCNCRDSHRESGNAHVPVRVTLPTKLDSVIKFRDFGTGLSPERVKNVFVLYGKSTKRLDNVQTGGFGIGAKSAWAYTDSFIIQSYFEGKCRTYIAHTGKNSNGTLELISEVDSTEPNGVEVQVPVKESDIEQFVSAVYRCTYFWDVKPELKGVTNVEVPASWLNSDLKISHKKDNWFLLEKDDFTKRLFDSYNQDIYVLIDKIPYSINKFSRECQEVDKLKNATYTNYMNFIEVGNGILEVSATRESISDKDDSKKSVNQICENARKSLASCIEEQFTKDFKDIPSYINFYFKMKATFNLTAFSKTLDFSFKKNGFSYKFVDGKIVSSDLAGCVIERYHMKRQKSRSVLSRSTNVGISAGDEKSVFVLINEDKNGKPVPEYVFKEKIKKLFSSDAEVLYVYTISNYTQAQRDNFKEHFQAIYLSDIKVEKNVYKNKRESGTVCVRFIKPSQTYGYRYGRNRLESDDKVNMSLDDIAISKDNYISIPFSSDEMYEFDNNVFVENINFLINYGKYKIIKLSKRDYDAVNTLDNVVEYNTVIENFVDYVEIDDKIIENYVFRQASTVFEPLRKSLHKIDCAKIKEYFEIKSKIPNDRRDATPDIPDRILSLYPHYSKASNNTKKLANLENEITTKYPLIKQLGSIVNSYQSDGSRNLSEFIFYLNAKNEKVS
jgi:hypothetical protein